MGHNNYKYFYLFLVYVLIGTFYVKMTMSSIMRDKNNGYVGTLSQEEISSIRYVESLCTGLPLAVGILLIQHTYFILTSLSSIESPGLMEKTGVNPFFEGTR